MAKESEIEFLREYKDFIYKFNMLDRNMAYCLRWMHSDAKVKNSFEKWLKMTFDKKLKKILEATENIVTKHLYSKFSKSADECRNWRNIVVHGNWEFRECYNPKVSYHVPEPFNQKGYITVTQFKKRNMCLKRTDKLLDELRTEFERKSQPVAGGDRPR